MQEGQADITRVVLDYFDNLFTSSRPAISTEELHMLHPCITQEMLNTLDAPFSNSEVHQALKEMHPCKSPGPDGLHALFYKRYWDLVGNDICSIVLNFLNNGVMPEAHNYTHVVLIPKKKNPTDMKDLRPISLCNVLYKLISKVLANRLKICLPSIIGDYQSAFVLDRLISNNILVAFEVFHSMNHSNARKRGSMAVKLDMSKAYDRIEWDYLKVVMLKMGFSSVWADRIMKCVTSVSYSFLVNGKPSDVLIPHRGLRQGDPLSPYLFLLCAEGLGAILKQAHEANLIHEVSIARGAPEVTHLFLCRQQHYFYPCK